MTILHPLVALFPFDLSLDNAVQNNKTRLRSVAKCSHGYECPEVVSRADWGAQSPRAILPMHVPVPYILIHHTYIPKSCNTSSSCVAAMQSMQNHHKDRLGWNDIGYNFAVGGDGHVYEGRGWDIVGAHSPSFNNISIGICLIGDYTSELPSTTMLNLTMELLRCATSRGSVQTDYKLLGHRQVRDTQCPGDVLFEEIKKWEHWDPYLNIIPRS
uniref:Peptidoglycan-recognition protein n=1 Tax=Timema poppense TaxID=170557 RepID=A0A7R9D3N0_TIMPO|nr:unnamed protein product [Timema poppensis]